MKTHKLLLIDDEEVNVRVLSMSLKADGYPVVTAYSGEQGLEVFESEEPDIVLTDIKMPGMDGLEVLRRVKALRPEVEVIIITGHGDIDSAIEALQNGASDFINKPIRDDVLALALQRAEEKIKIRAQLASYTHDLEEMVESATRELQRRANFQAKLIGSSGNGIVATDGDWQVVIYNPAAELIFGYDQDEVIERMSITDLFPTSIVEWFKSNADSPHGLSQPLWSEIDIEAKNGDRIPTRFSGTLLRENGKTMGSVAFFLDLREIKRLEHELVQSERLAAVGQTVAGMAHGIKNILHGFKGGSYLVNIGIDRNDDVKLKNGWKMIQKNVTRTSELVLDLLSFSKERQPELETCLPNEIVQDVCDVLQDVAREHDIELVKELSPEIGEAVMDPRTVHRSLLNLVSNAIDACIFDEHAKDSYRVRIRSVLEANRRIRFEVEDNGSGMDDEVRAKLFTSFFSTKGVKGTGLGLLVTKKMIEEHQGEISVNSQWGQGTTFTVRLPYYPADDQQDGSHSPRS